MEICTENLVATLLPTLWNSWTERESVQMLHCVAWTLSPRGCDRRRRSDMQFIRFIRLLWRCSIGVIIYCLYQVRLTSTSSSSDRKHHHTCKHRCEVKVLSFIGPHAQETLPGQSRSRRILSQHLFRLLFSTLKMFPLGFRADRISGIFRKAIHFKVFLEVFLAENKRCKILW